MRLSAGKVREFQRTIMNHYHTHGRVFPWRKTQFPYHILVSEIMLQQTQAERVVGFYERFLRQFPTVDSLSRASVKKVLVLWQGLGYNRRALNLHHAAHAIVKEMGSQFPNTLSGLDALPGVGPYTAAAVMAFAYNKPSIFIETNIRTVYLHFFFKRRKNISDKEILLLVEQTLDRKNPARWYQALMDYGAMLKRSIGNANRRSASYVKQSVFEGSRRQIRGKLVALALKQAITPKRLQSFCHECKVPSLLVKSILSDLVRENFLSPRSHSFIIK